MNVLNLDKDETDFKVDFNFFESNEGKNKEDGIGVGEDVSQKKT